MPVNDIRPVKTALREKYRRLRQEMPADERAACDAAIAARVRGLWQYRRCRTVLVYVSTPIEVDTYGIIRQAIADGKRVAVPRCVPGTRHMDFHLISSTQELSPGMFGVYEPDPERHEKLTRLDEGLCLVPAFSYDHGGYRLGYGKGYYDRFLSRFGGDVVGICYSCCVQRTLPHGRFDRPVDLLVTDKFLRRTGKSRSDRKGLQYKTDSRGEHHGRG